MGVLVFIFSNALENTKPVIALLTILIGVVGTFITQYPNIDLKNMLVSLLLPLHLIIGTLLTLTYFPNLGLPIKLLSLISFTGVFYIVSIINNVFLVVEERNESIPLFRAAVAWNQIILIVIAIPFFAGVFKLPINGLFQTFIVSLSAFMFAFYLLWILDFDKDSKKTQMGEKAVLSSIVSFLSFAYSSAVAFVPTESFLRAIFVASALMLGLNYLQSHLKNSITKKLLLEYLFISIIFFLILLVFKP